MLLKLIDPVKKIQRNKRISKFLREVIKKICFFKIDILPVVTANCFIPLKIYLLIGKQILLDKNKPIPIFYQPIPDKIAVKMFP